MTMTLIESVTVGSGGAANIEFTNIPQDGTDLLLLVSSRSTDAVTSVNGRLAINGDTAANYTLRYLAGNGSSTSSASDNRAFGDITSGNSSTSNTFGSSSIYFPNYAGSQNKTSSSDSVSENNATAAQQWIIARQRNNTEAITSLTYYFFTGSVAANSTASLYKITKA